jgi:hypothetical protein
MGARPSYPRAAASKSEAAELKSEAAELKSEAAASKSLPLSQANGSQSGAAPRVKSATSSPLSYVRLALPPTGGPSGSSPTGSGNSAQPSSQARGSYALLSVSLAPSARLPHLAPIRQGMVVSPAPRGSRTTRGGTNANTKPSSRAEALIHTRAQQAQAGASNLLSKPSSGRLQQESKVAGEEVAVHTTMHATAVFMPLLAPVAEFLATASSVKSAGEAAKGLKGSEATLRRSNPQRGGASARASVSAKPEPVKSTDYRAVLEGAGPSSFRGAGWGKSKAMSR